ncbi:MDR/zinc-dependent alcohol dehydrogenase-like family protein [Streptomyces olivochromogenes]|uniref:hypothetical protein n=1 Tax=Streptomyces olivochromogenes TaxID=1963 RepID=UPI0036CACEE3
MRAISPEGVDALLDASGRGEIPDSIELAGGPVRVLTIAAFDAPDMGIQLYANNGEEAGAQVLQEIVALIDGGRLRVPNWPTYSLKWVAEVLEASRSGTWGVGGPGRRPSHCRVVDVVVHHLTDDAPLGGRCRRNPFAERGHPHRPRAADGRRDECGRPGRPG